MISTISTDWNWSPHVTNVNIPPAYLIRIIIYPEFIYFTSLVPIQLYPYNCNVNWIFGILIGLMFNVFEILTIQQFLTLLYDAIYFIFSCNNGIRTQVLRLRIHNAKVGLITIALLSLDYNVFLSMYVPVFLLIYLCQPLTITHGIACSLFLLIINQPLTITCSIAWLIVSSFQKIQWQLLLNYCITQASLTQASHSYHLWSILLPILDISWSHYLYTGYNTW